MESHPGTQPKRWSPGRRRAPKAAALPPPPADQAAAPPAQEPVAAEPGARVPETAEIYRSLVENLRRAFGGTIDDANADAIAFAAAELYHKDVEPRLWEQKGAQEILDSFGVPRAGAFTRYSLTDRLLLLRGSATPDRIEQAHTLLDELGAPRGSEEGEARPSLRERLEWLLEAVQSAPSPLRPAAPASAADNGPAPGRDGPAPEQLVDALQTIRQAATAEVTGQAPAAPAPPGPAAADLVGLTTLVGSMQDELIRLRQAMETVQSGLDEALRLLRAGGGADGVSSAPAIAEDEPLAAAEPLPADEPPEGAGPFVGAVPEPGAVSDGIDSDPGPEEAAAPEPQVAGPDDVTRMVPVVPVDVSLAGPAGGEVARVSRRRRWSLPKLVVIAVLLGLVIAGAAIAISAVGWNEVRDTLRIGWVAGLPGTSTAPLAR